MALLRFGTTSAFVRFAHRASRGPWARALIAGVLLAAASPVLAEEPSSVVQRWFAALERKDFPRAIALTAGAAQARTEHMVGTLVQEAQAHHADVQLKVKRLEVHDEGGQVVVTFDIDVIGRKWFFHRVARNLAGTARFQVADGEARIVAIDGRLE